MVNVPKSNRRIILSKCNRRWCGGQHHLPFLTARSSWVHSWWFIGGCECLSVGLVTCTGCPLLRPSGSWKRISRRRWMHDWVLVRGQHVAFVIESNCVNFGWSSLNAELRRSRSMLDEVVKLTTFVYLASLSPWVSWFVSLTVLTPPKVQHELKRLLCSSPASFPLNTANATQLQANSNYSDPPAPPYQPQIRLLHCLQPFSIETFQCKTNFRFQNKKQTYLCDIQKNFRKMK